MGAPTRAAGRCCWDVVWALAAGVACGVGLLVAVRGNGVLVVVGTFLATSALEAVLVVPWLQDLGRPLRPGFVAAPVFGFVSVVTVGLLLAWGSAAFLVVGGLLVTAPSARDRVARAVRRPGARRVVGAGMARGRVAGLTSTPMAAAAAPPGPLPEELGFRVPDWMPVADVCQAWRSSYVALDRACTSESRLRVVTMRAIYLDELERRAGPAMQAWLRSGARAAGDPSRWVLAVQDSAEPQDPSLP